MMPVLSHVSSEWQQFSKEIEIGALMIVVSNIHEKSEEKLLKVIMYNTVKCREYNTSV